MAREYTQYEVNSQTFYESQSQQIIDEPSTNPNANHDFQAEFLKCMFNADQIEHIATNVRTNYEPGPQCDYDSQTDIETVVQTFMTGNPNWNENIASKVSQMIKKKLKILTYSSIEFSVANGYANIFGDS